MHLDDAWVVEEMCNHDRVAVEEQFLEDGKIVATRKRAPGAERHFLQLRRQFRPRVMERLYGLGGSEESHQEAVRSVVGLGIECSAQLVGKRAPRSAVTKHRKGRLAKGLPR